MRIRPLHDHVLIKPVANEEKRGGIYLPSNAQERPAFAEVVAVGSGRITDGVVAPMSVTVGDVVMCGKFAGEPVEVDGVAHRMVRDTDIFAVVDGR
jgi:chaperonin GroES